MAESQQKIESLIDGSYHPNPVKRVDIPKDNGQMRLLGIPTVVDSFIQQSINQALTHIYVKEVHKNSFGFRPKRSCHDALRTAKKIINQGNCYVVDLDLERFFDTVSHRKLIEMLSRRINDGRVVRLIHQCLRSSIMNHGVFEMSEEGTPQGGPLSPLLSNIMLNELDKELEHRGHKFVRYADDAMIFCGSKIGAELVRISITNYIEESLHLRVNKEKTVSANVNKVKYLGYTFGLRKGKCQLLLHVKSEIKLLAKLKELTSRSNGWGMGVEGKP